MTATIQPPSDQSAGLRILMADDNRDAVDSLAALLSLLGHEPHVAYNGAQALEMAETLRPDVILLDIGMPGLSGHDTARRLRDSAWGRDAVLIALTGWGFAEDRRRSREAGFDHHLTKPLPLEELEGILASVVRSPPPAGLRPER